MCPPLLPQENKEINKTYKNQGYFGDEKLYKKLNLLCLFILSYPHKENKKHKNKHFNSNEHEEKIYSKGNLFDLYASLNFMEK